VTWPDLVIVAAVLFGGLVGLKRGFVDELFGALALAVAVAAAFAYPGLWDGWLQTHWHLSPGSAHVTGIVLYAFLAFGVVRILGMALATVTKLPLIGTANALLGAVVGALKTAVIVWAVLYVALFFPIPQDVRHELHRSTLVALFQLPNQAADTVLRAALPAFTRPYAESLFGQHHV